MEKIISVKNVLFSVGLVIIIYYILIELHTNALTPSAKEISPTCYDPEPLLNIIITILLLCCMLARWLGDSIIYKVYRSIPSTIHWLLYCQIDWKPLE